MQAGTYISGAGHLGLIGWVLLGGVFMSVDDSERLEFTEVSLISAAEFNALGEASPDAVTELASVLTPDISDPPEILPSEDPAGEVTQPDPVSAPEADLEPDLSDIQIRPETDATDETPLLPDNPVEEALALLQPQEDEGVSDAERVAPVPSTLQEPDLKIDDIQRDAVTPAEDGRETPEDQTPTTVEDATTEIRTEANEGKGAPRTSQRPKPRPRRAVAAEENADTLADAVAGAVETALEAETEPAPRVVDAGPPLTAGEKDALRIAVQNCWNVGSLSSEALRTTVVIGVTMNEDGTPVRDSIRQLSTNGRTEVATRQAFEAGRRAIIRCGAPGFDLPQEKFAQWREIEITFNPDKMRIK